MNRDQYLNNELKDLVKTSLPKFNLLNIFEVSNLDKINELPFLYVYNPSDSNEAEVYNNAETSLDNITIDIIVYLGFKCSNDIAKEGVFQETYWELASEIEKVIKAKRFEWYSELDEVTIFEPLKYKGKAILNPNNGKGVGLAYLHFQSVCQVVGK